MTDCRNSSFRSPTIKQGAVMQQNPHNESDTNDKTPPSPKRRRFKGDHGEGVISAAIAVLIMAFLGAAMWVGFQQMWKATEATTNEKIMQIGSE